MTIHIKYTKHQYILPFVGASWQLIKGVYWYTYTHLYTKANNVLLLYLGRT